MRAPACQERPCKVEVLEASLLQGLPDESTTLRIATLSQTYSPLVLHSGPRSVPCLDQPKGVGSRRKRGLPIQISGVRGSRTFAAKIAKQTSMAPFFTLEYPYVNDLGFQVKLYFMLVTWHPEARKSPNAILRWDARQLPVASAPPAARAPFARKPWPSASRPKVTAMAGARSQGSPGARRPCWSCARTAQQLHGHHHNHDSLPLRI